MIPNEILYTMIQGIKERRRDDSFVNLLKSQTENTMDILNVCFSDVANAGLHVLDIVVYKGDNPNVLHLIEEFS